jgi:recombination protein RecT
MSNAPAVRDQWKALDPLVEKMGEAFGSVLPDVISSERFVRVALTELHSNPALAACNPLSILGSLMLCAQLGLEPGGPLGHAYLVPFKGRCTLIVGYKGEIELAYRSQKVSTIQASVVYENDDFDFRYGTGAFLRHVPTFDDQGEVTKVWAMVKMRDGGEIFVVLSTADVEKFRKRSATPNAGPWVTDWEAMAKKTAVRRLAAYLPQTIQFAAVETVERAESSGDMYQAGAALAQGGPNPFDELAEGEGWDTSPFDIEDTAGIKISPENQ